MIRFLRLGELISEVFTWLPLSWRKRGGRILYHRLLAPPRSVGVRLRDHDGDYGHGFMYEEAFCGSSVDIARAVAWCGNAPARVLDLAGGAGRFALAVATAGFEVTLVDNSQQMLIGASRKKEALPAPIRNRLNLLHADLRDLPELPAFDRIFSINNGFEHLDPQSLPQVLRRLRSLVKVEGRIVIDVHNPDFWNNRPGWKSGNWTYSHQFFAQQKSWRVWERTHSGTLPGGVVWEHAMATGPLRFVRLKTEIYIRDARYWKNLFSDAGLEVEHQYGDWSESPLTPQNLKIVFVLRKGNLR